MDLNEPLGMTPSPKPKRGFVLVGGGAVALVAVVGLAAILVMADPHGGEPYAVAVVPRASSPAGTAASPIDPIRTGSLPANGLAAPSPARSSIVASADGDDLEHGVRVFRSSPPTPANPANTGPLIIDVSKTLDDPLRRLKPAAVPPTAGPAGEAAALPRVAIFVGGMGLSRAATKTALDIMPPAVTFAFVPYGAGVASLVATAKDKGHEVLLQLPMQNASGGPPGPHALSPQEPADALATDLAWLTSRFDGYDGVTNLLGAPVTADRTVMTGLLKTIGDRGLFYLDDGTSSRSVAAGVGSEHGVGIVKADLVLDATGDPAVVASNLDRLVAIARSKGSAIGMASGLPDHLAAIARFATEAQGKGVTLVPVAALVGGASRDVAKSATVSR